MSSSATSSLHNKRLSSETTERGQRDNMDASQQLKLKERQRFFEEVFQHDVDVYLSSAHLTVRDYRRPPIGSVSSMEVNVDMLEQMELLDLSDQEALDVFLSSSGEEGVPGNNNNNNDEGGGVISNGLFRHVLEGLDGKSRMSSTSSASSNSQNANEEDGVDTPVFQSDDEEQNVNVALRSVTPPGKAKEKTRSPLLSSQTTPVPPCPKSLAPGQ